MTGAVTHQMMMLRPMQAGLTGYARLQAESRRHLLQVHLRGMPGKEMRVFWYAEERMVREVGRAAANARGEASLSAELPEDVSAPRRLVALLITDGERHPKPLAIGLCTAQSAGSLMDAKNALLALCERLEREAAAEECKNADANKPNASDVSAGSDYSQKLNRIPSCHFAPTSTAEKSAEQADHQAEENTSGSTAEQPDSGKPSVSLESSSSAANRQNRTSLPDLPREAFLPAIEARNRPERRRRKGPAVAQPARIESPARTEQLSMAVSDSQDEPERTQNGESSWMPANSQPLSHMKRSAGQSPVDLLPSLHWPRLFASLSGYFDRYPPTGLMTWPGWRFVHVPEGPHGLWIGYHQQDNCVQEVAYALPMNAPAPAGQTFRPVRTASGQTIQMLVLKA